MWQPGRGTKQARVGEVGQSGEQGVVVYGWLGGTTKTKRGMGKASRSCKIRAFCLIVLVSVRS